MHAFSQVKLKIGKKQARRRLPWDTSRMLQASGDSCPDGVYVPVSVTGDTDLSPDTVSQDSSAASTC